MDSHTRVIHKDEMTELERVVVALVKRDNEIARLKAQIAGWNVELKRIKVRFMGIPIFTMAWTADKGEL